MTWRPCSESERERERKTEGDDGMDSDVRGKKEGRNERIDTLGLLSFMLDGIGRDSGGETQ